jgi:hypothetical protein
LLADVADISAIVARLATNPAKRSMRTCSEPVGAGRLGGCTHERARLRPMRRRIAGLAPVCRAAQRVKAPSVAWRAGGAAGAGACRWRA